MGSYFYSEKIYDEIDHIIDLCEEAKFESIAIMLRFIRDHLPDDDLCPFHGDVANDCEDCPDSVDYHFDKGECVKRP
jgi:hypothetical protein